MCVQTTTSRDLGHAGRGSSGGQLDVQHASNRAGRLMRMAACLALSSFVGCASLGKKSTQPNLKPWPEIRSDFRAETLRVRMTEYAITFAANVDIAATA